MISLEQAKKLVELLENDEQQGADSLVRSIYEDNFSLQDNPMLQEIGSLTRDLHDSLAQFNFDERISVIANDEIPDARDRLQYVIDKNGSCSKQDDGRSRSLYANSRQPTRVFTSSKASME